MYTVLHGITRYIVYIVQYVTVCVYEHKICTFRQTVESHGCFQLGKAGSTNGGWSWIVSENGQNMAKLPIADFN